MSRTIKDKRLRRLDAESGTVRKGWGGRLSVALAYPNRYYVGMSNLGFQVVYRQLNSREDVLCERVFLPDREELDAPGMKRSAPLSTLESGRPLSDFDMIAFSVPFENDFPNILKILDLSGIPLHSEARGEDDPLIVMGGMTAQLNPEPLADFIDLFLVGEGEVLIPSFFDALTSLGGLKRIDLLPELSKLPGIYVPVLYDVAYDEDGTIRSSNPHGGTPKRVMRAWLPQELFEKSGGGSALLTEETEFGDHFLLEVGRGCGRGCRFCAAGFVSLPPRERRAVAFSHEVEKGVARGKRIGLISPSLADYSDLLPLCDAIQSAGGKSSFSSVRADALSDEALAHIRAGEQKTVTIAPEAGTERLRKVINKGLDDQAILNAVERIAAAAIPNIRLYFMIGLPTEEEEDIEGLIDITIRCRDLFIDGSRIHGRVGRITASVNCFVPKPFTPFQWHPMEEIVSLDRKIKRIKKAFGREANIEMIHDNPKSAHLQGLLSRGDRRVGEVLKDIHSAGGNWKKALKNSAIDPTFYTTRLRGKEELFPWEVIDSGIDRDYLRKEYERGLAGKTTLPCNLGVCTRCGIC